MTDQADRLRKARADKFPGESATDVARNFNWKVPTYLSHENGTRGFSIKVASRYVKAFGVNTDWLLYGKGEMRAGATVPLGGYIGTGGLVMPVDDIPKGAEDRVEAPYSVGPDTKAYKVRGDSQWPAFADGDLVYADKTVSHLDDAVGQLCMVMTEYGERMLKMVQKGSSKGLFRLISINAPDISDVKLDWAAPITWVKKRPRG